jgi:hypothetical protein
MAKKSDVTIIRDHLRQRHLELYGIDYVTNNHAMEGRNLRSMIDEYGVDTVRIFVEECFRQYKPSREWPGVNFALMFSRMRARVLPQVLAEIKRKEAVAERKTAELSEAEFNELL